MFWSLQPYPPNDGSSWTFSQGLWKSRVSMQLEWWAQSTWISAGKAVQVKKRHPLIVLLIPSNRCYLSHSWLLTNSSGSFSSSSLPIPSCQFSRWWAGTCLCVQSTCGSGPQTWCVSICFNAKRHHCWVVLIRLILKARSNISKVVQPEVENKILVGGQST